MVLMEERNVKTLVETGTARAGEGDYWGDGGSTVLFTHWASDHGARFFSIDLDPQAVSRSVRAVRQKVSYPDVYFVCSDSVAFLKNINQQIDFLYLDSFDYDERHPLPSQQHHLREIEAAYPFLTDKSIILIDDHNLTGGGKGKLVIEFLLQRGWKILMEAYQVILVKS
jgi:cephalosporin hydroxylase